ncbi:pilus assembly protein TadG-related protein [Sphingomicrobium nitratireducens]|uniref:pilus assembly protein TadG-related protein n=1 Tax=Sphingomicrobium nitratireducens TaxID=2964666 RepID=UPI00223FA62C|nr:pilus assembly protein TadG-related protein [Sphingomicrobium nitratireducens]
MARYEKFWRNEDGAVAPTIGLTAFLLVAAGGVAFDYARLATLDTEMQSAADQAALAAATQLDQNSGTITRATAAANRLIENRTLLSNDSGARAIGIASVSFYATAAHAQVANGNACPSANKVTTDADAHFVCVQTVGRTANFALTPVVGAFRGTATGVAVAGLGSAICKTPPIMLCNPDEPPTNTSETLSYNPARGAGLRLVTGDATVPGNFGWLESGIGTGANALKGSLGYNSPPGYCQPTSGVTTKPGMTTSVLTAINTRFDVMENGNNCPSQPGGVCSPAMNTRKDLACPGSDLACTGAWQHVPYNPNFVDHDSDASTPTVQGALPSDGSMDPAIMGYPHDYCHSGKIGQFTCGIAGNGQWDADAYFRVNYGWDSATWKTYFTTTDPDTGVSTFTFPRRYDVYRWELSNPNFSGVGIDNAQAVGSNYAHSRPASGVGGVDFSASQPDRRLIAIAVLNCQALVVKGKTTNVEVADWINVFMVEPTLKRGTGNESDLWTRDKDLYVEFVEKIDVSNGENNLPVRRDTPYLLK